MADAKLYEVQTAWGIVHAILEVSSGVIWTERTEKAARQFAKERGLTITLEQSISHQELLRLMGHEIAGKRSAPETSPPPREARPEPTKIGKPAPAANPFVDVTAPQLSIPVRYYLEDELEVGWDDSSIIARQTSPPGKSPFFTDGEITPKSPTAPPENIAGEVQPPH